MVTIKRNPQIRELNLISTQDQRYIRYQNWCRELRRAEMSATDKLEMDWIEQIGMETEWAVRSVLPDLDFTEKRVLRFFQMSANGLWWERFREVDLLSLSRHDSPLLIEVKSCTPRSFYKQIEKGLRQSEINLQILSTKYPKVRGALLMVNRSGFPLPEFRLQKLEALQSSSQLSKIKAGDFSPFCVDACQIGL